MVHLVFQMKDESGIHISPNPTTGQILVTSDINKIQSVKLFDVRGRVILEKLNDSNELMLDLEGLSKALYLVSIEVGNTTVIKKIIKQ